MHVTVTYRSTLVYIGRSDRLELLYEGHMAQFKRHLLSEDLEALMTHAECACASQNALPLGAGCSLVKRPRHHRPRTESDFLNPKIIGEVSNTTASWPPTHSYCLHMPNINCVSENLKVKQVAKICKNHSNNLTIELTNDEVPNMGYTLSNKKIKSRGFEFLYDIDTSIKEINISFSLIGSL